MLRWFGGNRSSIGEDIDVYVVDFDESPWFNVMAHDDLV